MRWFLWAQRQAPQAVIRWLGKNAAEIAVIALIWLLAIFLFRGHHKGPFTDAEMKAIHDDESHEQASRRY